MDYSGKIITKNAVTPTQTAASGVWTLDDALQAQKGNNWPIPGVPNPISKSLRFNSADSAYLNRTPAIASNRRTWTWSGWIKRANISKATDDVLFDARSSAGGITHQTIHFGSSDILRVRMWNGIGHSYRAETTQVFRDPSAWYHIVVALDTTQATDTNRLKIYVNGSQVTAFSTATYPAQNLDGYVNDTGIHNIGVYGYAATEYASCYMTEINFVDGQALTPSDFGMTDTNTGVWIPKKYTGTYGTNGFYVNFKDATNTTTLGYDYSGNGNNWNANNFSVTAGAGNDSMTDVPTPWVGYSVNGDTGGVVRGNYATMNPLEGYGTASDGNLHFVTSGTQSIASRATMAVSSGKWYWEITCVSATSNVYMIGVSDITIPPASASWVSANGWAYYGNNGQKYTNASGVNYGASYTANDVIGVALDMDNGTLTFYKNGVSQGQAYSGLTGKQLAPYLGDANLAATVICNFGQRPFAYTPPAGFLSLCTTNLPTPTIGATSTTQAGKYFNPVLYTGNGGTQSVAGVNFQPDFVWIKERSSNSYNHLYDAVRGAGKVLFTNSPAGTDPEVTGSDLLQSFNSNGFTVGSNGGVNENAQTYVAWNWKANGAGSTNTAGSVTSTVSANTTSGFSIATYTGNSSNLTFGHGLGVAPAMYVIKWRSNASEWYLYHKSLGADKYLQLNLTAGAVTDTAIWRNTAPTSSLIYVGSGIVGTSTAVCYAFAEVAGYSAFGSYTGNGSADGPFVYTGFRPAYVLFKQSSSSGIDWMVFDNKRSTYNATQARLFPSLANAEVDGAPCDFLSNGFKMRENNSYNNASGQTYIYAAFAESPFKFANAR